MISTDRQLLAGYLRGDRDAMGRLVARHIGMVYGAARRQLRDAHLAEDVTQAVFILLAQKAHKISGDAALASWLLTSTRYACSNARRLAQRRRHHEQRAGDVILARRTDSDGQSGDLTAVLDEAIASLPQRDRAGVVMSFFQNRSYREIGEAIGSTEEAARKRVGRAVDRLRAFFVSRGMAVPALPVMADLLTAARQAAVAPAELVQSTTNLLSLSAGGSSAASLATTIAQGVQTMWILAKVKIAAAVIGSVAATGIVMAQVARVVDVNNDKPQLVAAAISTQGNVVELEGGVEVEVLGVARFDGNGGWWTIDGKKLAAAPDRDFAGTGGHIEPEPVAQLIVRVKAAEGAAVRVEIPQAGASLGDERAIGPGEHLHLRSFALKEGQTTADIVVTIAHGPFKPVVDITDPQPNSQCVYGTSKGGVVLYPMVQENGNTSVYIATELVDEEWTVVCQSDDGEQRADGSEMGRGGKISSGCFNFPVRPEQIRALRVESREFTKKAIAKNITLDPARPTQSKLEVPAK